MAVRDEIEAILVKDLPCTITCPCCERDIDWEFDLDRVVDDLEAIINGRGVIDQHRLEQEIEYHNFDKERGC